MLAILRKVADGLIGLSAMVGTLALIAVVGVILVDVVGRYFGSPLWGAQDYSQMGMVIIVFGGMALCDKVGGQVAVDVFERAYPAFLNRAIDIVAAALGAVVFTIIAWAVYDSSKISLLLNLSTNIVNLPKAWFQWAVCALSLITALGMGLRAVELTLRRGEAAHHAEAAL